MGKGADAESPPPLLSGSLRDEGRQSGALPTLRTFVGRFPRHQVTHFPGCSSFATSVSTLTTGSQATILFAAFGRRFRSRLGGLLIARFLLGGNADQDRGVGEALDLHHDGAGGTGRARHDGLAVALGGAVDFGRPARFRQRLEPAGQTFVRSWPAANCTAPSAVVTASAPKMALKICDMCVRPSPHGDCGTNAGRRSRFRHPGSKLTVRKLRRVPSAIFFVGNPNFFWEAPEQLRRPGVIPAAGYPPCPIDRLQRARPW